MKLPETVLFVGDMHIPYHSVDAWDHYLRVIKALKPDLVVQVGDQGDMHAASKHGRRPGAPKHDLETEVKALRKEQKRFETACAYGRLKMLEGNHDIRLALRMLDRVPEFSSVVTPTVRQLYGMGGHVETHPYQELVHIGPVAVVHDVGKSGKMATHDALAAAEQCIVQGHTHRGECVYGGNLGGTKHFAMTVGWGGDPNSPAFSYASAVTRRSWAHGLGWMRLIEGVYFAAFCPRVNGKIVVEGRTIR
jgi:predicted phosphodiesterase